MFSKKGLVLKRIRDRWQLYVFLIPAVMYILIFEFYPMYGLQIAFRQYSVTDGIWGSEWVGLLHFERFFSSHDFGRILSNTLGLSFYELIISFPFPIILALLLNQVRIGLLKKSVQMVTYAPYFISVVVLTGIVLQILDPNTGLLNRLLDLLGIQTVNWMASPEYFKSIYVFSGIWQNTGFVCVIYLAALAGVSPTLHEAAIVDGASRLRRMIHIDLPGILPVIIIMLILNTGQILNVGYEKVLLLQNPLNLRTSEVIDTYVYKVGLTSQLPNYSYATAVGLFKSVISMALLISVNYIAKRTKQSTLW